MNKYYHYYKYRGVAVFEILNERLSVFNTPEIVYTFKRIIEDNEQPAIVIDLKNVIHIDSVGIGFLIAIKNLSDKKGYENCLVCENELVSNMLKISKMENFFTIFSKLDEAVQWILRK